MSISDKLGDAYVELSTRGNLTEEIDRQRQAAEDAARRRPVSIATSVKSVAAATGANPQEIARALGVSASTVPGVTTRFGANAGAAVHPMAALMAKASANTSAGGQMIERLSAFTAIEGQRQRERAAAEAEAAKRATARGKADAEAAKQTEALSKNTHGLMKELGGLAGVATGFSMGGLLSGGVASAAVGETLSMTRRFAGFMQESVALSDPGRAYRLNRAQADLQASYGRALTPLHDRYAAATRSTADFVAAHPEAVGKLSEGALFSLVPGLRIAEKAANWLGKGNENKSPGAAIDPMLGQHFGSGDDLYKQFMSFASSNTPLDDGEAGGAAKQQRAADKFSDAVDRFTDRVAQKVLGEGAGIAASTVWKMGPIHSLMTYLLE